MDSLAAELASVFDINFDKSLESPDEPTGSFDEKIKDAQAMLIPEPVEVEAELNETEAEIKPEQRVEELKKNVKKPKAKVAEAINEIVEEFEDVTPPQPAETKAQEKDDPDNPLGLIGSDLKAYHAIKEKYPHLNLYNGNPVFKDFYRYKVRILKSVLSKFPILNLKSQRKEMRETKLDHFIGEDMLHPDLVRQKMDECYRSRVRVVTLLAGAYEQQPSWKRFNELLQSKLHKEYDIKGAHKREGLVLEHLSDIEEYVTELDGFIQQSKYIDSLLVAASESLSRQLTCVQMKQPSIGRSEDYVNYSSPKSSNPKPMVENARAVCKKDPKIEELDTLEVGSVISTKTRQLSSVDFGVKIDDDDELMKIGTN